MSDEWFCSRDWSDEAQVEFEKRLSRSRAWNRAQYLRIKGVALQEAGEIDGARALWQRVLDEPDAGHNVASATEHLADSWREQDPGLAEELYRQLINSNPTLNGTSACAHLSLAELLLRQGGGERLPEATALLDVWEREIGSPFPSVVFRYQLARIHVAEQSGDAARVAHEAEVALDLALRGPVFARHPTVGLVTTDKTTIRRLRRLARGRPR